MSISVRWSSSERHAGSTVVEDRAKIDDNVEVGHNARVEAGASVTGRVVIMVAAP